MTWQVTWSLILGFTLSAIVQALVRKSTAQVVEAFTLDRDGTRHPLSNRASAAFPTTAGQVSTPPAVGIATGDRPARRHRPPAAGMER